MSLKTFHIVFVASSVLMTLVISAWCFFNYSNSQSAGDLAWAFVCLFAAAILVGYGRYFLKKLKHISYL
jgi:hypothetical protein